jgi:hypothetical protein
VQAVASAWDGERVAVLLQIEYTKTGQPEVLLIDGAHVTHLPLM